MKASLSLLLVFTLFSVAACNNGNTKPSYLFKAPVKEGIAAKAGDIEVTNAELADGIESEVFEAETKVFDIKFGKLKSALLQKLMDKDSRKKDLTNDQFLEKYITKSVNISEKEIDAFIKDQSIPAEHINPQVREKIKGYLEMERKKEAVDKWLAEQTKKSPGRSLHPKTAPSYFPG